MDVRILEPSAALELGELFAALHARHAEVAPELLGLPAVSTELAWERRRERYVAWACDDAFAAVAGPPHALVGYAFVTVGEAFGAWGDGAAAGTVQDLVVAPQARGTGAGAVLLDAVHDELRRRGATRMLLSVVASNTEAIAFYEHYGMEVVVHELGMRTDR